MTKTYKDGKVIKFINTLIELREIESNQSTILSNSLRKQLLNTFPKMQLDKQKDIDELIDEMAKYSYENDGFTLSHSQFGLLNEMMFHLGCSDVTRKTIEEMVKFFELDISGISNKVINLDNYKIQEIDVCDYSNFPRKFYIIIGGMGKSKSDKIRIESAENSKIILLNILNDNEISIVEKGFIIQTQLQNIPTITKELIDNNIGVYGIIPITDK